MKKDIARRKVEMKQRNIVSMSGVPCVLISVVCMMAVCPTGLEPPTEKPVVPKKSFVIKYDLYDCTYSSFAAASNWEL